jgi:hypothetical protein
LSSNISACSRSAPANTVQTEKLITDFFLYLSYERHQISFDRVLFLMYTVYTGIRCKLLYKYIYFTSLY